MSDPASLHKYLYTANDPVNMTDPTGYFGIVGIADIADIGFSLVVLLLEQLAQQLQEDS